MSKITVLDYGAGNLKSITNMLETLECDYLVSDKKDDIENASRLIFPGVGHFRQLMKALDDRDLTQSLIKTINSGIPFLGICLGFQALFESSEEAPDAKGLGIFKGEVKKFQQGKVPQIGWNQLKTTANNSVLSDDYFYFVNSYYVAPQDEEIISAYANYYIDFAAAVEYKNIFGMQFHPEKSGEAGLATLNSWMKI